MTSHEKIAVFGYVAWVVWMGYHYFFCDECRRVPLSQGSPE